MHSLEEINQMNRNKKYSKILHKVAAKKPTVKKAAPKKDKPTNGVSGADKPTMEARVAEIVASMNKPHSGPFFACGPFKPECGTLATQMLSWHAPELANQAGWYLATNHEGTPKALQLVIVDFGDDNVTKEFRLHADDHATTVALHCIDKVFGPITL